MKKFFCFVAVMLFTGASFAQTDTSMHDTTGMQMMHDSMMQNGMQDMHNMKGMNDKMKDCIMMMNGKVMMMHDGHQSVLSENKRLANNAVVMPDGNIQMPDGTTRMLKNEECIYMDGTMSKMPMKGKMKMSKDSTMM